MDFGALTPTVDVFEVLIVVALLVGVPAAFYNAREAWGEKEWAIDDPDPAMRRLGENRWDNARSLFLAMLTVAVLALSSLLVPSATQMAVPGTLDFQDMLNGVLQRVGLVFVVVFLTHKCVNDAVWRRYVDRRRRERDAQTAQAVADAPVVVVPAQTAAPDSALGGAGGGKD